MAVTPSYTHLEDEVLHLPRDQRSRLASRLLESLDEDDFQPSPEWTEELKRRTRALDEGRAKTIPSKDVWSDINKEFGTDL